MQLKHIVITCVDRDDLPDGGASIWAETISEVHRLSPATTVECLIGDHRGREEDLQVIIDASPEILSPTERSSPLKYWLMAVPTNRGTDI